MQKLKLNRMIDSGTVRLNWRASIPAVVRTFLVGALGASLLFSVGACSSMASNLQMNSSGLGMTQIKAQYSIQGDLIHVVSVEQDNAAYSVSLKSLNAKTGQHVSSRINRVLFPSHDPISGMPGKVIKLSPEVSGFSVEVQYPHSSGADRYLLEFGHTGDDVRLQRYKKEKLNLDGFVVSGIVADFALMKARWLGDGVGLQGPRSALPAMPLKQGQTLDFEKLKSVFDFSAEVDAIKRY